MINLLHLATNDGATLSEKARVACRLAEAHSISVLLLHRGLRLNVTPMHTCQDVRRAYRKADRARGGGAPLSAGLALVPAQLFAPPSGAGAEQWALMVALAVVLFLLGFALRRYVETGDARVKKIQEQLHERIGDVKTAAKGGIDENKRDIKRLRKTVHEDFARGEDVRELRQIIHGLDEKIDRRFDMLSEQITSVFSGG